jgi:hypothetical protein
MGNQQVGTWIILEYIYENLCILYVDRLLPPFIKKSDNIYQSMWLHMPEDSNLHTHLGENLKSVKVVMLTMSLKMFLIALMDRSKL